MTQQAPMVICLTLNERCEEAANFYVKLFPGSKITETARYSEVGREIHKRKPGDVLTISFEILAVNGHPGVQFIALNGGPPDKFNMAISLQVMCDTQQEVDRYWDAISRAGGKPIACGWINDQFGLSWQITPRMLSGIYKDAQSPGAKRVMAAMMKMVKLDIAELERAYAGS